MNRKEILRYMRTQSKTSDKKILNLADNAAQLIENTARPRSLYRIFDCKTDENGVKINNFYFKSRRLAENLDGCRRIVVFGATLGIECDRLIRRTSATDTALAAALQAAAAAKIEEVCDELEATVKSEHSIELRQRFSPGYYDLDIGEQKNLFSLIELTKRIGINLTETLEMVPTKSVTAFIGVDEIDKIL